MAYEQPRVPIWREGNKLTDYIKELVRFLRSFTVAAWNADRLKDDEIKAIKALIESSAGGGGITVDAVYPVGSIYMSVNETSPAELFGGTWEQIHGRFLLGADATYPAGSTGGEATHSLTISEMPSHTHGLTARSGKSIATQNIDVLAMGSTWDYTQSTEKGGLTMYATGEDAAHNNMPPYLSVYMWKRTA